MMCCLGTRPLPDRPCAAVKLAAVFLPAEIIRLDVASLCSWESLLQVIFSLMKVLEACYPISSAIDLPCGMQSLLFKEYLRMRPRHLRILSDIVLHLVFVLGFSVCQ